MDHKQFNTHPNTNGNRLNRSLDKDRYEARNWLRNNPNTTGSPFATNRFGLREQASAFVDKLYAAGAARVEVTNIYAEDWRLKSEGGPYADTLVVTLPADTSYRQALFTIADQEAMEQGEGTVTDVGQSELTLWWD